MFEAIASLAGGLLQGAITNNYAQNASNALSDANYAANDQIFEQLEQIQQLLSPFIDRGEQSRNYLDQFSTPGTQAFQEQQAILGLRGPEEQAAIYDQVSNSPEMQQYLQQGEEAILQNASATGGLRGGNTQAALAKYRPEVLNNLINQRYQRLGQLSNQGLGVNAGFSDQSFNASNIMGNNRLNAAIAGGGYLTGAGQAQAYGQDAKGEFLSSIPGQFAQAYAMMDKPPGGAV